MEFFEKYKKPILAAVVGALTAIVLSYLIDIPFWITGAIIGAVCAIFTDQIADLFDEQTKKLKEKQQASKAKKEEN